MPSQQSDQSYSLKDLAIDPGEEKNLRSKLQRVVDVFRQMVAHEGLSLGPIKLKDPDLNRVHDIVNEIDSRRAFYNPYDDEIPAQVLGSVMETREQLRGLIRGVWADLSAERIVRHLMEALDEFVTHYSRLEFPETHWEQYKTLLPIISDLRVKCWFSVALLKLKFGSILNPIHLPDEVLIEARNLQSRQ